MHRYAKGKRHLEKKRIIVDYINKVSTVIMEKKQKLADRQNRLMKFRQEHISDLTTYIFPVSEVRSKG